MDAVEVVWKEKSEKKYLEINISGYLSEENAKNAVTTWQQQFEKNVPQGEKVHVVCNCIHMTRYSTEARNMWQSTIGKLKKQISCLWIVTDNKMFIVAAGMMSLVTKFKIKTVKSEADIILN